MVVVKEVTAETGEENEGARGSLCEHTIQLKSSLSRPLKPPKTLSKRSNPARPISFFVHGERGGERCRLTEREKKDGTENGIMKTGK